MDLFVSHRCPHCRSVIQSLQSLGASDVRLRYIDGSGADADANRAAYTQLRLPGVPALILDGTRRFVGAGPIEHYLRGR